MLKNLLLVAVRNLRKDKWYSLINIVGLMIGITFSVFLILYILDEWSYDRYNTNANRIYRVVSFIKEPERDMSHNASTQIPLIPELARDYPEIEQAVRLAGSNGSTLFANGDKQFYEDKVFTADSNVFKVFTWPVIAGDAGTALMEPNSIVLTRSTAEKYFGPTPSVIGKTLRNGNGDVYKVTAVVADEPANSHLRFNALISASSLGKNWGGNDWGGFGTYSYVLLRPGTNVAALEKKMLVLYDKFMAKDFGPYNIKIHYGLQPITSIHLHSDMVNEPEQLGNMSYIYIFGAIAVFLLLIACINYMNLTTARSARRAKEIGIRKVTGSTRPWLIAQFLVESVLIALIACAFSLVLFTALLPTFNLLSGKSIILSTLFQPGHLVLLVGVVLLVGLAGGAYPAFYLSRFNPVSVLKGNLSRGSGNANLRRILVITQFSISMCMLICTWVVHDQLVYLHEKDLGFSKDQVMTLNINGGGNTGTRVSSFVNDLRKDPEIRAVSTAWDVPGGNRHPFWLMSIETKDGFTQKGLSVYAIDENFVNTLGMKIVAGRNFTGRSDTVRSILVNEAMAKEYGWDHPLGKKVKWVGDTSTYYMEVVGVIKDFNQASLYNPIAPLMLLYRPNNNGVQIKVGGSNIPAAIASVEKTWKTIFPELPFSYTFLDQDFDSQYVADQKRGQLFMIFSILTLSITCLGLLGLIAFITGQRQKEISIRKVMGARAGQIAPLLFGNFVLLVCISCLIAFPVAAIFMNKWLKLFFYSPGLTVQPFLYSTIAVLFVTTITVGFHTVKAAIASPIHGLRSE